MIISSFSTFKTCGMLHEIHKHIIDKFCIFVAMINIKTVMSGYTERLRKHYGLIKNVSYDKKVFRGTEKVARKSSELTANSVQALLSRLSYCCLHIEPPFHVQLNNVDSFQYKNVVPKFV